MKFLDKDTVLRLLKQDEINHSVVISDPNIIDCPMVYVSEEPYRIHYSVGKILEVIAAY